MPPPERIAVVGSSGSGKSTLARRCAAWGLARLELDALAHQPGWSRLPAPEMRARIAAFVEEHERWVIDGNYADHRDLVFGNADTVVWLDLPRRTVMRQLVTRTLRRLVLREELWNGNRERWQNLVSTNPDDSVIAWSWTHFDAYRADFAEVMGGPAYPHLGWHRLRSAAEARAWPAQHLGPTENVS